MDNLAATTQPHSSVEQNLMHNLALAALFSANTMETKMRLLQESGITIDAPYYAIVRIGVSSFRSGGKLAPSLKDACDTLRVILEDMLRPICTAYFVTPTHYSLATLLCLQQPELLNEVRLTLLHAADILRVEYELDCCFAVSYPVTSLEACPTAERQASDLLATLRSKPHIVCMLSSDLCQTEDGNAFAVAIRHLSSLLQAHQYHELRMCFQFQAENNVADSANTRCMYAVLENFTVKHLSANPLYSEALVLLSRLQRAPIDTNEWYDVIDALASTLTRADNVSQPENNLEAQITAYVSMHQSDPELSLNVIAEAFHISVSRASRAFKHHTGMNMVEFLRDIRVSHAKELLRNSDLSIQEVAAAVGYTPDTMTRVFNRMEHVSPTQYRSISRQRSHEASTDVYI